MTSNCPAAICAKHDHSVKRLLCESKQKTTAIFFWDNNNNKGSKSSVQSIIWSSWSDFVSRATLGKLLRDWVECLWAFPSATMPSWAETETETVYRSLRARVPYRETLTDIKFALKGSWSWPLTDRLDTAKTCWSSIKIIFHWTRGSYRSFCK